MKKFLKGILQFVIIIACFYCPQAYALIISSSPQAYNNSAKTLSNTPVNIDMKSNHIPGNSPLVPGSITIVTPPTNGTIPFISSIGVVTYVPNPFFVGTDSFVYQICDTNESCAQATVYIAVNPVCKPCPTVCPPDCCKTDCLCEVNECMCTLESFAQFSPASGTWVPVPGFITTSAPALTLNFLKYNLLIDQTYEEIEVNVTFPPDQPVNSQFTSAGLVTNWNGTDIGFDNQKVAYISFDNNNGNPQNAKLAVGGLNTESIFFLPFQIQYNTPYTLRLIKNQQFAYAFINNIFIGSANTGVVTGNYVGVWSYQANVKFDDFKSCSYREPLSIPS